MTRGFAGIPLRTLMLPILLFVFAAPNYVVAQESHAPLPQHGCSQLLDKALDSIGPRDTLKSIRSMRSLSNSTGNTPFYNISIQSEHIRIYSGSIYLSMHYASGGALTVVITPDSSFILAGKMKTDLPPDTMREYLTNLNLDPVRVAQRRSEYGCSLESTEEIASAPTAKLKLTVDGTEGYWNVDPVSGRILRASFKLGARDAIIEYSDWRQVSGIYYPFQRHYVGPGITEDTTIKDFQVNPTVDASLFQLPANQVSAITLSVLQNRFVPYVVRADGALSAQCDISGTAGASPDAPAYTRFPELRMTCKLTEDSVTGTAGLNAMLVETSDGFAHIISCDPALGWSDCSGLKGGPFFAVRTTKGLRVQIINTESKSRELTYTILKSKSLHE